MGIDNFERANVTPNRPESMGASPEEIKSLENEAVALTEETQSLQKSLEESIPNHLEAIAANPDKSELFERLRAVQNSWQKVKDRAWAIAGGSLAFGALLNLAAPALENPNLSVSEYNGAVDSNTWIIGSVIAVNAIGYAVNMLRHSLEESGIREEITNN